MKKIKKLLSIMLALLMAFAFSCFFAYAEDEEIVEDEETVEEEKLNFVMMGDSIAWGAGVLNSSDACYAKIIADSNGYNYTTLASNGYQTKDLVAQLTDEADSEVIKNADIIAISVGGNNFLYAGVPRLLGDYMINHYQRFDAVAETFRKDFDRLISGIKELNPDVTVFVQTLFNPRYDFLRKPFQLGVDRVNFEIRDSREKNPDAFELIDLENVIDKELVALDTIHPTREGNEIIAGIYLERLYELGLGTNTELVIVTPGIDQNTTNPEHIPYLIRYFIRAVKFYYLILFA